MTLVGVYARGKFIANAEITIRHKARKCINLQKSKMLKNIKLADHNFLIQTKNKRYAETKTIVVKTTKIAVLTLKYNENEVISDTFALHAELEKTS